MAYAILRNDNDYVAGVARDLASAQALAQSFGAGYTAHGTDLGLMVDVGQFLVNGSLENRPAMNTNRMRHEARIHLDACYTFKRFGWVVPNVAPADITGARWNNYAFWLKSFGAIYGAALDRADAGDQVWDLAEAQKIWTQITTYCPLVRESLETWYNRHEEVPWQVYFNTSIGDENLHRAYMKYERGDALRAFAGDREGGDPWSGSDAQTLNVTFTKDDVLPGTLI